MDGSAILDVAIGLALLYLLLSLLVSLTSEYIARLFDLRAKTLRGWLKHFLDSPTITTQSGAKPNPSQLQAFYESPLIAALKKGNHLPSYIPSKMFATALLDLALPADSTQPTDLQTAITGVQAATGLPDHVKRVIVSHLRTADGKLEQTREELAAWFDGAMGRVSGWYSRKMQWFTLSIALVVTLIANADTFLIADKLWQDVSLRQATVEYAKRVTGGEALQTCEIEPASTDRGSCLDSLEEAFSSLGLPLFNHLERLQALRESDSPTFILKWAIGIIVTAAALSFGARFWFDVLTKLVNIRLTGKPPEESAKTS